MTVIKDPETLAPKLTAVLKTALGAGATIDNLRALTGGASRTTVERTGRRVNREAGHREPDRADRRQRGPGGRVQQMKVLPAVRSAFGAIQRLPGRWRREQHTAQQQHTRDRSHRDFSMPARRAPSVGPVAALTS